MIVYYCTLYLNAVSSYNGSGVLIAIDYLDTGAALVLLPFDGLSMLLHLFPLIGDKDIAVWERRVFGCHFPKTAILNPASRPIR